MAKKLIYTILLGLTLWSCSTEKNALINRTYHYTTTRFNGYFHGNEALKLATKNIKDKHVDDYDYVLDIFQYGDETINKDEYGSLNRAINKGAKMIDRHSMKFVKKGEKIEANKMINDCYMLIGKARFFKYDLFDAQETFIFVQTTFDKEPIKYDATLWLIKSYIYQNNFVDAETQIQLLRDDKEFPKKLEGELLTIEAASYMRNGEFEKAIDPLEKAIALTKKRKIKHRLNFILAQLYQKAGNKQKATELYTWVAKKATDYELQFNAKISLAKTYDGAGDEIVSIFKKMLKDDKNKEYRDQIYFALAQVYERQNKTDLAIENYKLSAASSINNPKQKGKAFLALGDYYFDIPDYPEAADYYDSSLIALPKDFPNYSSIEAKKNSLAELVKHLKTIELEDSLQNLANMTEEEKMAYAEKQIEKAREAAEVKEAEAEAARAKAEAEAVAKGSNGETWIFDNPTMLTAGYSEFIGTWGNIKLTDNWRRSDKSSVNFDDVVASNEQQSQQQGEIPEDQTVDFYLKGIPSSTGEIEASNTKIQEAYYAVAVLYRDQFKDMKQSNHYFELLNKRYPKNKREVEALYQLYRNYDKMKIAVQKDQNKQKILKDYPSSEYAQLLLNPNMLADKEKVAQKANLQYEELYKAYAFRRYQNVVDSVDLLLPQVKGSQVEPRFSLLRAFALGQLKGKEVLEKELSATQSKYMGTTVANEIDLILGKLNHQKEKEKKQELDALAKEKEFKLTKTESHLFLIVFSTETVKTEDLTNGISNFNKKFFSDLNLNVKTLSWSENDNVLVIKPLTQEKDYFKYYQTVQENFLKNQKNIGDIYFTISKTNYAKLFKFKDVVSYADFFKKNYFPSEK